MNTLRVLALTITTLTALTASASRALSISRQLTLADGRTVTARLIGDERVSFYLSTDNEMILRQGDTYVIATPEQKDSIRMLCEAPQAPSVSPERGSASGSTPGDGETAKAKSPISGNIPPLGGIEGGVTQGNTEGPQWTRTCPSKGNIRIPVILVEFADGVKFTFDHAAIDEYFNKQGVTPESPYTKQKACYNYGSIAEYLRYCSFGQFQPQFDLYGPYTVSYKSTDFGGQGKPLTSIVTEALRLADADIDYSQYDSDNDNYIDNIFMLYAGYGSHSGADDRLIWAQASNLPTSPSFDGKRAYRYCASNELALFPDFTENFGPRMSIGVTLHEFCHTLGLPDLYPTTTFTNASNYDNQSMESWSLMDYGGWGYNGFAPTPLTAWERAFLGWTEPLSELSEPADVTLRPLADGGQAMTVRNEADTREYYVLEALPATTGWYRAVPASGMMITHVVWDANTVSRNTVNNTPRHPLHHLVPADGYLMSSYNVTDVDSQTSFLNSLQTDLYPLPGQDTFIDYKPYTGTIDKPITDIAKTPDGTVTFRFMGGLLWGDVDGDGQITMADANLVVNHYLGTVSELPNSKAADLDHDGQITMADANAIVNEYLGN